MELITFPIGHAGTTLTETLDLPNAIYFTVRPCVERTRANRGAASPATDDNARTHDYNMFKSLLDSLTDLDQSRLLGIIRNMKRIVDDIPGGVGQHRAHSKASLSHHHAAHRQGAATHTHR